MVQVVTGQFGGFFTLAESFKPCAAAGINVYKAVLVIIEEGSTTSTDSIMLVRSLSPIEWTKSSPIWLTNFLKIIITGGRNICGRLFS